MTSDDFCHWLKGVFELDDIKSFDEKQTKMIRQHLKLAFIHEIDPSMGDKEHQALLQDIHDEVPRLNPPRKSPKRIPYRPTTRNNPFYGLGGSRIC